MKELIAKLRKEALEVMNHRVDRLSWRKIWLQRWLRWHKIKRELRKVKKIREALGD